MTFGPKVALDFVGKAADVMADPATFGGVVPPKFFPKAANYADDMDTKNLAMAEIAPLLYMMRGDKQTLHEEWNAIRRMELMTHDEGRKYYGRSDVYLPLWQRALTTVEAQLSSGLFPTDDYFDCSNMSMDPKGPEMAKSIKAYMQWELETNAKVQRHMKPFLRQFVSYGNAALKFLYRKNKVYRGKMKRGPLGAPQPTFAPTNLREGLEVFVPSIFNMYVYPYTATSIDECSVVAEDIAMSQREVEYRVRIGDFKNGAEAISAPAPAEYDSNSVEQLGERGGFPGAQTSAGFGPASQMRVLTEVWCFLKLPSSAYVDGEDMECDIPTRILFAGNVPVVIERNPYWHQSPPYLFGRQNVEPGAFWGYGNGRPIRQLQYLANDFANQSNDVGIYSLNPIAVVNPTMLNGPMPTLKPGAVIKAAEIEGAIKFLTPPIGVGQEGYAYVNMVTGMFSDASGAPPVLQGTNAKGSAKTATGAQILQRNSLAPLQDIVEDLEMDVTVPLLVGAFTNAQQFRNADVMAIVAGQPIKITPEQLALDCSFRWLASSQMVNAQMRSQQALQLIQAVMPLVPMLNSQGYVVNFTPMIQKIYADDMGFRGFEEFIHQMSPQEQMQQMAQMGMVQGAQNPQAPQAEQGGRIRSAVEQAAGSGGAEEGPAPVPGEGGDFDAMRAQVEDAGGYGSGGFGGDSRGGAF